MDLSLSEEQRLLGDAAGRFAAGRYSFEARRAILQSADGFSRDIWREFADLGWLGLNIPEDFGGLGTGAIETGVVMEAFGRALVVEPYLQTAVVAANLISGLGTQEQKQALLPPIAEGRSIGVLAHGEPQARYVLDDVATTAMRNGSGWTLSGRKDVVLGAPWADMLLVSARISGGQRDRSGIGLFLVPAKSARLTARAYQTVDGARASNIVLENVAVPADALLGGSEDALPSIEAAIDRAIAAMASEALGCMQVLLDTTIAYTKTRIQFGKPLAANQVLQHRMAAMAVKLEEARGSALNAALMADADPVTRARAASGAKVKVGRAGRFVAEQAVQLHGGMGVTEELNVGAYFKRLMAIEIIFGSPDFHLQRYMRLAPQPASAA
ncbi:acyl-CoA dehydrogenase [Afipia sp. P52-10]|jgi:alkylation response protein AidB-like acyl-CoA dehydrogenase|uniref:acyl-CoA dehydrogenase family protein n=1 Tax=Afipia sp. P52-10 TaxID=1429916 RepID=UPI0003DF02AE|nr:acyl-CoA dehydrogenase [Afipia sp. P52-10]ETR78059.1 acyl-CoA dehydrogenase [Afipia sp. P52-10]